MSELTAAMRRVRINGVRQCLWSSKLGGVYTLIRGRPVVYRVEITSTGLKVPSGEGWIHEVGFHDIVGPGVSTELQA